MRNVRPSSVKSLPHNAILTLTSCRNEREFHRGLMVDCQGWKLTKQADE